MWNDDVLVGQTEQVENRRIGNVAFPTWKVFIITDSESLSSFIPYVIWILGELIDFILESLEWYTLLVFRLGFSNNLWDG